ncbi:MAG: sugar transferase [bacterium]|nr:sugar transferase [bacterium]
MENRKHTRLLSIDDTLAQVKGGGVLVGKISDISLGGLGFSYMGEKAPLDDCKCVDIHLDQNGFYLPDVPCAIVYDTIDSSDDSNGDTCRRCGLQFGALTDEHKNKLNYYLCNFTTGLKKGRRLATIAVTKLRSARRYAFPLFIDFLLLTVALLGVQMAKRQTLKLSLLYLGLFAVFYLFWLAISLIMEKYRKIFQKTFLESIVVIVKSNIALVYLISLAVVLWSELTVVSRMQTFGVCAVFLLLELGAYSLYYLLHKIRVNGRGVTVAIEKKPTGAMSYPLIMIDAVLVMAAFMVMNYFKRDSLILPPGYDNALLLIYAFWAAGAIFSHKFSPAGFKASYAAAFSRCIKAAVFMGAGLGVVIFAGRLHYFSRLQLFGVPLVLLAFETLVYYLYCLYWKQGKLAQDIETTTGVREIIDLQESNRNLPEEKWGPEISDPVETKLRYALEFFDPKLLKFIKNTVDLASIDRCATALMSTDAIDAIVPLADNGHRLFINLHKTNDVRWFNRYFLQVYKKLKNQGYFIGKVHTFSTHKMHYYEKFPKYIAGLFYYINFMWCRIIPKLPFAQKFYFTLTQGRNRIVSKAEIFGRLYFCGFKVVDDMEIDNRLFFIAQKVKMPSYHTNPTYGPLVRLKRIGFNGRLITVYKFRTMFAYSEFLQEYVYQENDLETGGKFKDDFRVTDWGRFMRATWLDELPMIYNWLKGDLQLLGVRPLSRQYLGLYTDELRKLRTTVLPGLIPPFYADMPKTLPEIIESELRYLKSYSKAPLKTQLSYLWQSFVNIIFKGARSK